MIDRPAKPGRKAGFTRAKHQDRIFKVAELLAQGRYVGQIKRYCREEWNIKHRQAGNYIRRAQQMLARESGKSVNAHAADSYAFYRSIQEDAHISPLVRIKARQRIDRLYGTDQRKLPSTQHLHGHFWGGVGGFPLPPADLETSPDAIDADEISGLPSPGTLMAPPDNQLGFLEQASEAELIETMKVFQDFDLMRTGPQYQLDSDGGAEGKE